MPSFSPALILSIDTATLGGGVCLADGNRILASVNGDPQVSHSNSLLRDINRVIDAAGLTLSAVGVFAAAAGPGSFTGLRIGLATTKALAMNLGRPCVGIPTLQAIAHSAGRSVATVATLPAGRGELYTQLLSVSDAGAVVELDAPAPLSPNAMVVRYGAQPNLKWAGPGVQLYRELIRAEAMDRGIGCSDESAGATNESGGWILTSSETILCEHISALAQQRLQEDGLVTAAALRANYVRLSDAELKK